MKKTVLLVILLFLILSLNFMITGSADEGDDWHVVDSWSISFSNTSAVPLYPELIISVAEEHGNSFDIEWRTNATGVWKNFAYNLSSNNGTFSQIAKWANESETTYWWSLIALAIIVKYSILLLQNTLGGVGVKHGFFHMFLKKPE